MARNSIVCHLNTKKSMRYPAILLALLLVAAVGCKKEDDASATPAGSGGGGATACSYTTGGWGAWTNGYRERTVAASPTGCTGTPPASNRGWLRITNNSTNPYRVTVTGPSSLAPFDLPGGYMQDSIYVGTGSYGIYALQLSGYVFTASEFNGTRGVVRCNLAQWSFP